ncbi:DedA family protein [Silvanigrella sp.]|jgi:membrane-associated protein|uniref:DedA family protein n=1 Tax=Silvanigrella sp. TaxID=2024976 RepID=UPI0037C7B149|nr:VTT domain-containing protein [Silvanigrellaceae bacterium]
MDIINTILQFLFSVLKDPIKLIQVVGYTGLILIVFAETGLLIGFFLPGDSLLIAAGLFAAKGDMNILFLISTLTVAAIVGDAVGFYIGRKLGPKLYKKEDSFFFRKKHLIAAHEFYEKHGGKTIIIARFIPIIRTFAPTVAGAAEMNYFRFAMFNVIGGFLWVWSMLLGGFYLGRVFGDKINDYIHYLIIGVIIVSFIPIIIKWIKTRNETNKVA